MPKKQMQTVSQKIDGGLVPGDHQKNAVSDQFAAAELAFFIRLDERPQTRSMTVAARNGRTASGTTYRAATVMGRSLAARDQPLEVFRHRADRQILAPLAFLRRNCLLGEK